MNALPPPAAPPDPPAPIAMFLRLPDVLALLSTSKTTLYKLMRDGEFPRPIRYTPGYVVWPKQEVADWIERHGGAPPAPALN
jgi:prophage regulatory protein